jgi:two-component system response regulator DesR
VIRALLAMEGGLIRGALAYVLSKEDILVVAELGAVAKVLDAIPSERPDVVVADFDTLKIDGLSLVRDACEESGHTRLLLLMQPRRYSAVSTELPTALPTIGLLANNVTPERVVEAVRALVRGEPVLDGDLVAAALGPTTTLTVREVEVLQLIAQGFPIKEIAAKLSRSPGTVRNHLSRILVKTGARSRIEAIERAREAGWI